MTRTKLLSVFWHGVAPDSVSLEDLDKTSSLISTFRAQIRFIVSNYTPVSIADFLRVVRSRDLTHSYVKPPVLLSFDDGFESVITNALPVLTEFGVPAAFFVVGEILQNPGFVPWYLEMKHLVRKAERKHLSCDGVTLNLESREDQARLRRLVAASFRRCRSEGERQGLLNNLAERVGANRPSASDLDADLRVVSADTLAKLSSSGLLTVASHAMTHRYLAALSYAEQLYELEQSDRLLRAHCPAYYPAIAYPDGSFNADTISIASRIYRAGFAVLRGSSYGNLHAYPRVGLDRRSVSETAHAISPARLNVVLPLKRFLDAVGLRRL